MRSQSPLSIQSGFRYERLATEFASLGSTVQRGDNSTGRNCRLFLGVRQAPRWKSEAAERLGSTQSKRTIRREGKSLNMPTQTQTQRLSHLLKPLQCSEQDDAKLRELAETLVLHSMEQYNALEIGKTGAPANKNRWKEVRKKEGTKVFKERATKGEPLEMPSLMLLGSVVGNLEDVMYAVVTSTTEAMRLKSAVIQDGIVDCKVLRTLVAPNLDDPFRWIGIDWHMLKEPQLRDHVCLDSTGIATSASGERIGYHLVHSIGFDQVPSFASYGVARGNMSVCALYVQTSPMVVGVYARGYFDFNHGKNELANNAALTSIAVQWLSFPRVVECAQVKKLLWTMHKNNNRESIMSLTSDEGKSNASLSAPTPGLCKVCSKSFGFLGTSRKSCMVCNDQICARCSVTKTIVMLAPNKLSVIEKKRAFCVQCINDVTRTDAVRVAREEILNAGKQVPAYMYY